jgi:hypothetical protein
MDSGDSTKVSGSLMTGDIITSGERAADRLAAVAPFEVSESVLLLRVMSNSFDLDLFVSGSTETVVGGIVQPSTPSLQPTTPTVLLT